MKDSLSCFFNCSFLYEKLLLSLQQHYSNRKVFLLGLTLVPTTVLVMESVHLVTRLPAECTANVTNIGKGKLATSRTVETTAEAPTTATATSLGRSCASATTVGKVRGSSVLTNNDGKGPHVSIDANNLGSAHLPETIRNASLLANRTFSHSNKSCNHANYAWRCEQWQTYLLLRILCSYLKGRFFMMSCGVLISKGF